MNKYNTRDSVILPPSESLRMSRNKVLATSLLSPSGALLAWNEMMEKEEKLCYKAEVSEFTKKKFPD